MGVRLEHVEVDIQVTRNLNDVIVVKNNFLNLMNYHSLY